MEAPDEPINHIEFRLLGTCLWDYRSNCTGLFFEISSISHPFTPLPMIPNITNKTAKKSAKTRWDLDDVSSLCLVLGVCLFLLFCGNSYMYKEAMWTWNAVLIGWVLPSVFFIGALYTGFGSEDKVSYRTLVMIVIMVAVGLLGHYLA